MLYDLIAIVYICFIKYGGLLLDEIEKFNDNYIVTMVDKNDESF